MSKICLGCGVLLQAVSSNQKGYVPKERVEDAVYCERCFRLKHYHEMRMDSLDISNEELLTTANKFDLPVYYFLDLLNLNEEALSWYRQIKQKKVLVLTKVDLIPFSISLDQLKARIQSIYQIEEEIFFLSTKKDQFIRTLWNHILEVHSSILFLGMTNVGKSSFLNELSKSVNEKACEVLISEMPNTTQAFLEWQIGPVTIFDAPGFNYSEDNRKFDWNLKTVPKRYFRPVVEPMKRETVLFLEDYLCFTQNLDKNSVVFYGSNELVLQKKYHFNDKFTHQETLLLPAHSDLVLPGIGFFYFKQETEIVLQSKSQVLYEIRDSLIGGSYDTN